MLTPVNVSIADYIQAVKTDRASHVKITFLGQNIVLTDEDIEASGLTVQWYLNSDTDLTMGRAMMATVQMPILNSAKVEPLLWGGEFTLEIGQEVNNTTEWTLLGYFQGNRPSKVHSVKVIDFTAHDRMSRFDVLADDWVSSLTFPMTVEDIYHSLCDYCGIEYVSGDELPDIMSRSYTENPIRLTGVLCRDILAQIAEACCCYARINTEGKCQLVWYADHSSDYTLTGDDEYPPVESFDNVPPKRWSDLANMTWSQLSGFTWQDLKGTRDLFRITGMNIVDTIANAKYCYPDDTGRVVYMIVDNPFLAFDGESQSYIQDIYNRLQAFGGYLPISVDCVGNALIEVGDVITVALDGELMTMPIFCKTLTWNGGMVDHYEATGNLQRQEVSPENMVKINESGRYKLVMGQVELIARDKYDKQSGILITPEGVRIDSGKTFDVVSENFTINSEERYVEAGDWSFSEKGLIYILNSINQQFIIGQEVNKTDFPNCLAGMQVDNWGFTFKSGNNSYSDSGMFEFLLGNITVSSGQGSAHLEQALVPPALAWLGSHDNPWGRSYMGSLYLHSTASSWNDHGTIYGAYHIYGQPYGDGITDAVLLEMYNDFKVSNVRSCNFQVESGRNIYFETDATVYAYAYQTWSTKEVKHDIKPLKLKSDVIDKLKPVSFIYNGDDDNKTRFGLIYEDTVELLPEVCSETNDKDGNKIKGIDYASIVPILLKETQELRKRVAELEKRVNDLEGR